MSNKESEEKNISSDDQSCQKGFFNHNLAEVTEEVENGGSTPDHLFNP